MEERAFAAQACEVRWFVRFVQSTVGAAVCRRPSCAWCHFPPEKGRNMKGRTVLPRGSLRSFAAAIALLLVWSWSGTARAQDEDRPKYTRSTKIKVNVKRTKRTQTMKPKEKKEEVRPVITADDFIRVLGKVTHIRKAQIIALQELIKETDKDDPELPDLHFRLSEMYAQQQRYWHSRGMEMYSKIDKAKGSSKTTYKRKQQQYFNEAKKYLKKAIKQYKALFDNQSFRNYPRMDEALFYYAYTLQGAKYMKEARKVYHRLIKDYPKSKYIPDAYLSFADYFFEQNSLANAEKFYDKVLQFPKASIYTYALYKKGWVYLNLTRFQEALETFYAVVQKTKGNKKRATLNRAAKKDFVRAYAEIGKAQKAYKAFQRVDKGYAFTMLQILGDIYLEQGKAKKSIFTFREMIGIKPKHKLACEWQYNVVHAMLSVGSKAEQVKEIENLVRLYSHYKDKKILPENNLSECHDNAEAVTSEMAKTWHNEAMKTLNTETLAYVERLYHVYLEHFPDAEDAGEMQYYYAELLWQRAENEKRARLATELWEKAAIAFTDVVKSGKVEGKLLKESAYAAVLGWKNALAVDPRTAAQAPSEAASEGDKIPEPKPIGDREKKMIDAFDIYIDYIKNPKDEELVMMKFLKARIYWRHNHFDEAIPLFQDIVQHNLLHETGEYSANLLLDTLNRTHKYKEMIDLVDFLIKQKKFLEDKEDLAARLELLKRQSLRKAAEQLEKDGQYVDCGQAYVNIYNRDPEGEGSDEVLYNAGVCFEQGKSIGASIAMFTLLSKRFPKSNHSKKAIARLGRAYGKIAWYDKAAERFEYYAKKYGGEKDAYQALSDAVFYRKGIGDDEKAISDTKFFTKQYKKKKPKQAAAADYSLVSIYEKQGDDDKVVKHLRGYLKDYGKKGGVDRQIISHAKIGMILWKQSCKVPGVMGACVKITRQRSTRKYGKKKKRKKKGFEIPTQCGPESKIKVTLVDRDRRTANRARQEFQTAIKLWNKGALDKVEGEDEGEKAARTSMMIKYYAASRFYMAEQDYEKFLAIKFPQKLNFDERKPKLVKKSKAALSKWVNEKTKLMHQLSRRAEDGQGPDGLYRQVIKIKGGGAHYAIAAAARIGQLSQNFSDALFTASIPKDVRTGPYAEDKYYAYCDELMKIADPLEAVSVNAFSFCLDTSTQLNWFNEWSKLCEKELGQIRPAEFPTAIEIHKSAQYLAPITDIEPVADKLAK